MGRSIDFRGIHPFELRGKEPPDRAYVSSSPSKIPYGGFSPVRLQTGFLRHDLRQLPGGLSVRSASTTQGLTYTRPIVFRCNPCSPTGHLCGARSQDVPVQRPLAHHPVVLSGRVVAYYGLICASRSLLPLYGLCSRPAPCDLLWAGSERVPNLLCVSVPAVPSSVPRWIVRLLLAASSPHTLAFAAFVPARHPQSPRSTVLAWARHEAAKFPLWYGPMSLFALHRQGRLRSSFHPLSRLTETSNITTRANSQFPATGLSPARHTALWAASE